MFKFCRYHYSKEALQGSNLECLSINNCELLQLKLSLATELIPLRLAVGVLRAQISLTCERSLSSSNGGM